MSKMKKTLDELLEKALVPEDERPYEIPEGWGWVKLGSIIDLLSGRDISNAQCNNEGKGIPYIMGASNFNENALQIERWIESPTVVGIKNDILISVKGTIGKILIQEIEEAHLSRQVMGIRTKKGINNKFIYYYLTTHINQLKELSKGVIPGISREDILEFNVPIPTLKEQKRIAEKIESFLSKIEEAKQLIEEAKETFELRRAAAIKELIDIAISKVSSDVLEYKALSEIFKIFGGGTPSKSIKSYWDGSVNWFSAKDIKTIYLENSMDKITELGVENSSAKMANKGSIVIVTRSGILKHSFPVAKLMVDATVNQDLKVFSSDNQLLNDFLFWYIQANEKYLLEEYSKSGTTVNSIEFDRFKTLKIPVLPNELLNELLNTIQNVINKEDKVYQILNTENSLDLLKQSILSKAFKGELGTNDKTDEPAIDLLKSILQEKL